MAAELGPHGTGRAPVEGDARCLRSREYEHELAPPGARRSLFSVTLVCAGFSTSAISAMNGSVLVIGMGSARALAAMIIGNLAMLAYSGALGVLGARSGANFALSAALVFGRKGCRLASLLLSTLLLGWFTVQTGVAAALASGALGLGYAPMAVVAGLLPVVATVIGVRGLHAICVISMPIFLAWGLWVAGDAASTTTWAVILAYPGAGGAPAMSMGVGITFVIATMIDASTVTADFNRWAKTPRSSMLATFSAIPLGGTAAMLLGGVMTAALAVPNAAPFEADNMFGYVSRMGSGWLAVLASGCLCLSVGAASSHCLYSAALGWSRVLGTHMRVAAALLGLIGTAVAACNLWGSLIHWLTLLSMLAPPAGAVILVDQYWIRPGGALVADHRPSAFVAWAVGVAAAFAVKVAAPQCSAALCSMVASGVAHWALSTLRSRAPAVG